MWFSQKRILLWHTARNILAIFYTLQIGIVWSCGTEYDDVQSKAILSQVVIAGRIQHLAPPVDRAGISTDYKSYRATVQVLSVLSPTENSNIVIQRKDIISIEGFIPKTNNNTPTAQSTSSSSSLSSSNQHCLSPVSINEEYILFINLTSDSSNNNVQRPTYRTAQLSVEYTKTDKKLIKDVLCDGCVVPPNAKSKRNLQITEGAENYKVSCRAEGNPPPDVRWYKDGVELSSTMRGIAVKRRRRRGTTTLTIRIKTVKLEHAGTYRCIAKSLFGEDTAKSRLTVIPSVIEPRPTPTPPSSGHIDWNGIDEIDESEDADDNGIMDPESHYIPCTGRDRNYCLHDGTCEMFPDGRYKHCRCLARFTGARCEEANIIPPTKPFIQPQPSTLSEQNMELKSVIIALATVLFILIILMVIFAFYIGGYKYRSQARKRLRKEMAVHSLESERLLDETDSKRPFAAVQSRTTATQTDLNEPRHPQVRESLNLENFFPHSNSDVVLRRKSSAGQRTRPASQPLLEKRQPRSRLSGTSTLTENKRVTADSEFQILPERVPSSSSIVLDITRPVSSSGESIQPQAYCDQESIEQKNSLYISESNLNSHSDSVKRSRVGKLGTPYHNQESATTGTDRPYHLYNGKS